MVIDRRLEKEWKVFQKENIFELFEKMINRQQNEELETLVK